MIAYQFNNHNCDIMFLNFDHIRLTPVEVPGSSYIGANHKLRCTYESFHVNSTKVVWLEFLILIIFLPVKDTYI